MRPLFFFFLVLFVVSQLIGQNNTNRPYNASWPNTAPAGYNLSDSLILVNGNAVSRRTGKVVFTQVQNPLLIDYLKRETQPQNFPLIKIEWGENKETKVTYGPGQQAATQVKKPSGIFYSAVHPSPGETKPKTMPDATHVLINDLSTIETDLDAADVWSKVNELGLGAVNPYNGERISAEEASVANTNVEAFKQIAILKMIQVAHFMQDENSLNIANKDPENDYTVYYPYFRNLYMSNLGDDSWAMKEGYWEKVDGVYVPIPLKAVRKN